MGNFLYRRNNIVGLVLGLLVLCAHIGFGLGFLWPVAVIAAYGAGVMLTPPPDPTASLASGSPRPALGQHDEPGLDTSPEGLGKTLDEVTAELQRNGRDAGITNRAVRLRSLMHDVLNSWGDLEEYPEKQSEMVLIITQFLPDLTTNYLASNTTDPEIIRQVNSSLDILIAEATQVRDALRDDKLSRQRRALQDSANRLRLHFGELPDLGDGSGGDVSRAGTSGGDIPSSNPPGTNAPSSNVPSSNVPSSRDSSWRPTGK